MDFKKQIESNNYLSKKYDYYFLFHDNEIYNNLEFNQKIKSFSLNNTADYLIVDLINLKAFDNYKGKSSVKIPLKNNLSLEYLDSINIEGDKTYEDLLFEFLIFDNINNWEIYCNVGKEFAVAGCNSDIAILFDDFIKPYEYFSFEEKLEELKTLFVKS
ncbi:hypothetical protein MACH07_22920 [Flagellimonas marinaquae]|uniref:Uncharacterized protein n=1 Tax=Flagellimonas marinaquae TaxID=254955 RepID=A0AA48HE00_9FLAO|nr:hypothetical protein MACH07_22920 [Allomuricauda aquimarina]